MLEKIAERPEAQRFSMYSQGGGPGAIYSQVQKIFCHNLTADPGSIPIISTFFLYQQGYCETAQQILDSRPTFERQINEMADGTGNRPAVYLLELDAVGASKCEADKGALSAWEGDIGYEIDKLSSLPHTVVYVEAGYSDGNGPAYTASVLNAVGINRIRRFFTNDTHINWTMKEIKWAERVSTLTHGAHFIVNTAQNGHGPLLNPHPVTQGNEDLCNPPGRGLGPLPTTAPGFPFADGFLWTHVPGNSSGCGGGPPAGTFWMARAIRLAANANGKLGPGYPSSPY
jgi:endoglucanase